MKSTMLFVLLSTFALGQGSVAYVPTRSTYQFHSHTERAVQTVLATQQNLLGNTTYTSSKGEMPLSEVKLDESIPEVPLGDVARALKTKKEAK